KPGWTCPATNKAASVLPSLLKDVYDVDSGSLLLVWFRCQPPFDKPDVRKALASLVDREALVRLAFAGAKAPPLASHLVPLRTTGLSGDVRLPTFDRSKAKAMYGGKKMTSASGN